MLKKVVIGPGQIGLDMRGGKVMRVLKSQSLRYLELGDRTVLVIDVTEPEAVLARLDAQLRDASSCLHEHIDQIDIGATEVGAVYKNGRLTNFLAPGARAFYWKDSVPVRVEKISVDVLEVPAEILRLVLQAVTSSALAQDFNRVAALRAVAPHEIAVLSINGQFKQTLAAGNHAFWKCGNSVQMDVIDVRTQFSDITGQEILSKDKVTLRFNLSAHWQVVDVRVAKTTVADFKDALYRELQFALRQVVGTRTLDELLANKQQLDADVAEGCSQRILAFGVKLISVGVKDIILPGEMRELLNQVVNAEKTALANVIKRREETAATRSLLNTAKLMEESPILLRLKELESLEKVVEKVGNLTVLGGVDGLMKQLVSLKSA